MARPWKVLSKIGGDEGVLELRQRGDSDFLIVIGGRVLMNSYSRSSEEELSRLGLAHLRDTPKAAAPSSGGATASPRVLIAGLGMGFTLRAALDVLPPAANVVVCEIDNNIVEWCRGPLAAATNDALADRRVELELVDVAEYIARSPNGRFDAILLDLYEGPNAASQRADDKFYGAAALARSRMALRIGGVLGVWSEDADAPFEKRFVAAGFDVTTHSIGTGGRRHIVYLGRRRR